MKIIIYLLQKEFRQIFRNRGMLPIIFIMPVIQLLILANAATYEIKDLKLFWVDFNHSDISYQFYNQLSGSNYFKISGTGNSLNQAEEALLENEADLAVVISPNFEKKLVRNEAPEILVLINAIDGTKAGLSNAYLNSITADFNQQVRLEFQQRNSIARENSASANFEIINRNWFNPELDYKTFMVPGILVLLVTMIGAFLSSMNIVKEKEIGTIEQLNVTPIKKYQFIIGKLLPFWIIGIFELALGLIIARIIYQIPMIGSMLLIFGFASIYLMVILGLGLLISTVTETQQQAMFISWFFLVIFILMSGLFTPIENMPDWAQLITLFNPVRYFIEVTRMVMLKGAGYAEIQWHLLVMIFYTIGINSLAVLKYKKTV